MNRREFLKELVALVAIAGLSTLADWRPENIWGSSILAPCQLFYNDRGRWVSLGPAQNIELVGDATYFCGLVVPDGAEKLWRLNDVEAEFQVEVSKLHKGIGRMLVYGEGLEDKGWFISGLGL